jgi:fucose permease
LIACILLGVGAMACNTTGNVLGTAVVKGMFDGNEAAANNLVNVFFGLGLFLTPFVVSFLFQKISYEKAVSALGVIILLPLIGVFMAVYPTSSGFKLMDAISLLKEPATILAAFVLFCYIALEASFTNWLAPFGKEVLSNEKPDMETEKVDASAARLLSAFAIAMMVGRLITSFSGITRFGGWLIAGAAVLAAVIIIVMTRTKSSTAAYALAAAAGLVFAPAFPTTIGVTFAKFGGGSGSLFGIIFAVGLAGAVIVPKAIGNMAKGASVQKALKLLLPACAILVLLAIGLHYVKGPADKGVKAEVPVEAAIEAVEAATK